MTESNKDIKRSRLFYFYIAVGTIAWSILGYPIMEKFLGDPTHIIISAIFSFLSMAIPFYYEFPLPQKGKEHYILLYPVITIPLLIIGIKIREIMWQ